MTAALLLVTLLTAGAQAAGVEFGRCAGAATRDRSRCGRLTVPLDRGGALPGSVDLKLRVLPPRSGAAKETVVALAGGPGQGATSLLPLFVAMLERSLPGRQLVLFDQRGTGGSGRLACKELDTAGAGAVVRAVGRCAERLGARRAACTTSASVEDLEAVRAALGVDRIALFGVSYGTKVALDYAARYPQHVSRLVLDSVVLPEGEDLFMRSTLAALPRVMRSVCSGGGCPFTRDVAADLARVGARLQRGPLRGRVIDWRGRPRAAAVDGATLLRVLLFSDGSPQVRAELPALISAAAAGDVVPLLTAFYATVSPQQQGEEEEDFSAAVRVATRCEDGLVPWPAGTPVSERAAATEAALAAIPARELAPFGPATLRDGGFLTLCHAWPESPIAQPTAPPANVPTLILSGEEDLRTPLEDARRLAATLPQARLLTIPQTGHSTLGSDFSGCAPQAVATFLRGAAVADCKPPSHRVVPTAALRLRLPSQLTPVRGLPPRLGRTVAAAEWSYARFVISFLNFQRLREAKALPRRVNGFGGLRGGSVTVSGLQSRLRGYSVLEGVTLTGRTRRSGPGDRFRIGGRNAVRGTLTIGQEWTSGTLDGRRVRVRSRVPELVSAASSELVQLLQRTTPAARFPHSPQPGALR